MFFSDLFSYLKIKILSKKYVYQQRAVYFVFPLATDFFKHLDK